jgi:ribose-phosphate pyrophosphokinase
MQTIVLKDFECDVVADHILYPDGQKSLRLNLDLLDVKELVTVKCRITFFAALEYLLCLVSALRKNDFHIQLIEFVYLIGMRSDRAFNKGEPNYFRDVIAPIINGLNVDYVKLFYPHSNLSTYAINRLCSLRDYNFPLPKGIRIKGDQHADFNACAFFQKERISRDNIKVILNEENILNIKKELNKHEGALIVDDLCDAGGTFIADAICFKEHFPGIPLNLFIMHGLFTKGFDVLLKHFDHIYCTNSYQDISHPRVTQYKVI